LMAPPSSRHWPDLDGNMYAELHPISPYPSGNLILILFGRFKNAAFHMPFSSENPFLKISSFDFLPSF
jgi:hypothetical protein